MACRPHPDPAPLLFGYDPFRDVPRDHLAWLVQQVVELTFAEMSPEATAKLHWRGPGQPRYDPRLCVKVLLYGYATGVRSSRQLERLCYESLPYLLLAGGDAPTYRTLCSARRDLVDTLEQVWLSLFMTAKALGLERVGRITLDSSKFKANASPESVIKRDEFNVMLDELKKVLDEAEVVDKQEGSNGGPGNVRLGKEPGHPDQMRDIIRRVRKKISARERQAKQSQQAAAGREQGPQPEPPDAQHKPATSAEAIPAQDAGTPDMDMPENGALGDGEQNDENSIAEIDQLACACSAGDATAGMPSAEEEPTYITPRMRQRVEEGIEALTEAIESPLKHLTLTDPDARMMQEGRYKKLRECHSFEAAVDNGLLVAGGVTQDGEDSRRLLPLFEAAQRNEPTGVHAANGDSGFYSGDVIAMLVSMGIDVCIPDPNTASDIRRGLPVGTTARQGLPEIPFVYDAASDSYLCPQGNRLTRSQVRRASGQGNVAKYRAQQSCRGCPLFAHCMHKASASHRTLNIGEHHALLQAELQRFNDPAHRERYHHRGEEIETIFGFIRNVLGFGSWLLRGKEGVDSEGVLFKAAYQIRKVLSAGLGPAGQHKTKRQRQNGSSRAWAGDSWQSRPVVA